MTFMEEKGPIFRPKTVRRAKARVAGVVAFSIVFPFVGAAVYDPNAEASMNYQELRGDTKEARIDDEPPDPRTIEPESESQPMPNPCDLEAVVCPGEVERDSREDIWNRIQAAAGAAGIDPEAAVRIAACESGLNPKATNPHSTAKGLYQFLDGTWAYI